MFRQFAILILLTFLVTATANAKKLDPEVYESLRCIKMFPYFEKRLGIPSDALHSIALKESGRPHSKHKIRIVWPWTVNVEGQGHYFNTKREAVLFVKKQLLSGKESIDVGCMQINLRHHPDAFKTLDHAFDPRINVAYGALFLRSKYDQLKNWGQAIAHYHSATHDLGVNYKNDVVKIIDNMPKYKNSLRTYVYERANDNKGQYFSKVNSQQNNIHYKRQEKLYKEINKPLLTAQKSNKYRSNMMVPVYSFGYAW